jgi:hypothetical protein
MLAVAIVVPSSWLVELHEDDTVAIVLFTSCALRAGVHSHGGVPHLLEK